MATAGALVVSMQSGQAGALACRPSSSCALLLYRAPPGLSLVASPSPSAARFISIPRSRTPPVPAIHAQDPDSYDSAESADNSAGNREGIQSNPSYGNAQSPSGTSPSAGYGATQFPPGHGGSSSTSSPLNTQSAPSYGNTSSQRAPSYDGTKLSGQSATLPSTPSYDSRSRAPPYGNSSKQPLYSDGTVTGKSFRSGSGWAVNNSTRGTSNYGVDMSPTSSYRSQSPTSSYSSQPSSSTRVSNNQSDSAFGKSIPRSYGNNSPQLASAMGKSTIQSGSGYGIIKDTAYGNSISPSYGDRSPPSVTQSSPSYGVDSQSVSSYSNTGKQSGTISTLGSSQKPSDFSSIKSSPGSSIPRQPSYGEAQPSARSFTTQAAPSAYDGSMKSPIGSSAVALGRPPSSVDTYEDIFKNYGAPDAAEVEPWLMNTSFRSGPMFGSPQPSSLNRLFVGNLAVSIDDATLQELFSKFGTVLEARVLRDQESGRSRGFAVVAMSSVDEVKAASKALDGCQVESRPLKVDAVTSKH